MNLVLISYSFDPSSGMGIGRYGYQLREGLRARGFDVEIVNGRPLGLPSLPTLRNLLLLRLMTRLVKGDIYHSLDSRQIVSSKQGCVVTVHDLIPIYFPHSGSLAKFGALTGLRHSLRCAKKIIAVSELTKHDIEQFDSGVTKKVSVVSEGVSPEFCPQRLPRRDEDKLEIGYVGGFEERKNLMFLVNALKVLHESFQTVKFEARIYGNPVHRGSCYIDLARKIRDFKLDFRVKLMGWVSEKLLPTVYNSFDVFVFPSMWEGFGLPILEAQRCKRLVITIKNAHIPSETSRYTLKVKSEKELAGVLCEIYYSRQKYQQLVESAYEYSKRFTWDKCVELTVQVYEEAMGVA